MVELAEVACNDVGAGTVPINTRVSRVASVMAEAVAEVVAECTGQGNSVVTASGFANAEATAEAVGNASARIVVTSEACELCTAGLEAFTTAVETVAVTAVAEASIMVRFPGKLNLYPSSVESVLHIWPSAKNPGREGLLTAVPVQADFMFQEGIEETLTARDIQRTVEQDIIDVLASVVGTIRTDPVDGCSANGDLNSTAGDMAATCDVAVSADDIRTEVDAVATAGAAVRALACEGGNTTLQVDIRSREIATAVARAIVQVDSFCESTGGPGTMGCGLGSGSVTAIARATARAFASGVIEAGGDDCICDLSAMVDAEDMVEIIAAATTSARAEACTGAPSFARLYPQLAVMCHTLSNTAFLCADVVPPCHQLAHFLMVCAASTSVSG